MSLTVGSLRVSGVPSLDSRASTISKKISDATTAGFNSKVHTKVTLEPRIGREKELWSLLYIVNAMEDGVGTLDKTRRNLLILVFGY